MKGGQAVLITIFVVLLVVLGISFYFYYFGTPELTGRAIDKKISLVETQSPADNLIVPEILQVYAIIGKDNNQNFEVTNQNDRAVSVSCTFPPFQPDVPSSNCFTYDSGGKFVGEGEVEILPGERHVFTASVKPFDGIRIKKKAVEKVININPGEYSGEVELKARFPNDPKKVVSVLTVPVEIVVSN